MSDFNDATRAIRNAITKEADRTPTDDLNNECDFIRIKNLANAALCLFAQKAAITQLQKKLAEATEPKLEEVV